MMKILPQGTRGCAGGEFFRGSRAERARKALTSVVQYLYEKERREDTAPYQGPYIGLKSVFGVMSFVNCARSFAEFSRNGLGDKLQLGYACSDSEFQCCLPPRLVSRLELRWHRYPKALQTVPLARIFCLLGAREQHFFYDGVDVWSTRNAGSPA